MGPIRNSTKVVGSEVLGNKPKAEEQKTLVPRNPNLRDPKP